MAMAAERCVRARSVVEGNCSWLELPRELVELILTKLASVDIIRFRAVCSSWYATANSFISSPLLSLCSPDQSPWLMLPTRHDDSKSDTCFFNFAEQKVYKLNNVYHGLELHHYQNPQCVGSSYGWLIIFDEENCNTCLLNPFTGAKIELPSTENLGRDIPLTKAILLSDPRTKTAFTIVILYGRHGTIAFYRHPGIGDNNNNNTLCTWTEFGDDDEVGFYCDIICHDNMLYALEHFKFFPYHLNRGVVHVWDFHDHDFPKLAARIRHPINLPTEAKLYLAESLGNILYVLRVTTDHDHHHPDYKDEYCVYKLDYPAQKWDKLETLNGRVLFLGGNKSISLCARDFPEWEQNSLYISYRYPFDLLHNTQYLRDVGKVGVCNIQEKSLKPNNIEFNIDPLTYHLGFTPFWIVPNLCICAQQLGE